MNNIFYDSLAPYYQEIFPLSKLKVDMMKRFISKHQIETLLDIGCATGEFTKAICHEVKWVKAFDLDDEMIAIAKTRQKESESNIQFEVGNMLEINNMYENKFDLATCFGNTLVHLNQTQVMDVLRQIYLMLTEGGFFIGQIINYDYVFEKSIKTLPIIENDQIRFERTYELLDGKKILFDTKLFDQKARKVIENKIPLYPIRKKDVENQLIRVGFEEVKFYKNYKMETCDGQHLPLIFIAKKEK